MAALRPSIKLQWREKLGPPRLEIRIFIRRCVWPLFMRRFRERIELSADERIPVFFCAAEGYGQLWFLDVYRKLWRFLKISFESFGLFGCVGNFSVFVVRMILFKWKETRFQFKYNRINYILIHRKCTM